MAHAVTFHGVRGSVVAYLVGDVRECLYLGCIVVCWLYLICLHASDMTRIISGHASQGMCCLAIFSLLGLPGWAGGLQQHGRGRGRQR